MKKINTIKNLTWKKYIFLKNSLEKVTLFEICSRNLEIDFVMRYKGECVLLEVKAKNGNTKSTKTILSHPEKYNVHKAIKLIDGNIGRNGNILTLPLYFGAWLSEV